MNQSESPPKLQGRVVLSKEPQQDTLSQSIEQAQLVQGDVNIEFTQPQAPQTADPELILGKSNSKRRYWLLAIGLLLGLSVVELSLFVVALWQQQDWLAALWLGLIAVGLFVVGKTLWREWRTLRKLKYQEQQRMQAESIVNSPSIGMGKDYCLQVSANLPQTCAPDVKVWHQLVEAHHNDREVVQLFEQTVVSQVDKRAVACITQHAAAASAMIAISPFALLDMLIVLWRNLRMMDQICELYGLKLGYWARIAMIRRVFHAMLYAGATEILADAGNYALSAGVTGKLSSRLAQGLGAGVLTTRIGLRAMQQSRPFPFLSVKKPTVSGISSQLLKDLKNLGGNSD